MKKTILLFAFLGMGIYSYAQDLLFEVKVKKESVPEVVIESIEEDFPDFTIGEIMAIPISYVEEDVYVNHDLNNIEDYDTYEIDLSGKGTFVSAVYDRNGKLLSTSERLKDVALPSAVRQSIVKEFPGWTLVKDVYVMSHYGKGKKRERYKVVLTKDGNRKRIHTDPNGKIL